MNDIKSFKGDIAEGYCPFCRIKFSFYEGLLGYEALKCKTCGFVVDNTGYHFEELVNPAIKCMMCRKDFIPKLKRPEGDDRPIQQIFPNASLEDREEIISHTCRDCQKILFKK